MIAIESLDAWSQEGTYSGPSLRDGSSDRWQSDPRVEPPHHSQERIARDAEIQCDDAAARADHPHELASCPNERSAPARSYVAPIPLKMRCASSAREAGIAPSGTHRAARIVAGCDAPARPIGGPEHDVVWTHRYAVELPAGRRANRRDDRGRARNGRRLTHAFGAVRSVRVRMLDEHRYDRRHVERGRKQVVGERSVPHVSVAELHLLHHGKPE